MSSSPEIEQLVLSVAETDDGGGWETVARKRKNKSGNSFWDRRDENVSGIGYANSWATQATGSTVSTGQVQALAPLPLEGGWIWHSGPVSAQHKVPTTDALIDLDASDEDLASDDYDSDVSQKSHGTRKQNKWFHKFFDNLDSLSFEQINEPERQWDCPACQGGTGAVKRHNLQGLLDHAKTRGRVPGGFYMDSLDMDLKESIKQIHEKINAKEENLAMLLQQERAKVQQENTNLSTNDDFRKRDEVISGTSFIDLREKKMELEEREKLIKEEEKKMAEWKKSYYELKKRHYKEMRDLEKKFDESLE